METARKWANIPKGGLIPHLFIVGSILVFVMTMFWRLDPLGWVHTSVEIAPKICVDFMCVFQWS